MDPWLAIGLPLVACCAVLGASPRDTKPVILPVVDATDIRFSRATFGASKREPAYNRVHSIAQDAMGFLWFATQDKLQRYDGYEIREYPNDPDGPVAVFTEAFLLVDRRNILWGGWARGLDRFDPATESFKRYSQDTPFNTKVFSAIQDHDGKSWFAADNGLIRLDPDTGRTVTYEHNPEDPASLSSSRVRTVLAAKDGTLWVATKVGVDWFDRQTGKVRRHFRFPPDLPDLDPNPVLSIAMCEDHAGVLWMVFSYGYGLGRIDRDTGEIAFYSLDGTGEDKTLQSGARSIIEAKDHALWIGTTASGLLRLNRERSQFARYRNNPADANSLSGDQILGLLLDREGNVWAGTNGAGVNRFSPRPSPFRVYQHRVTDPNSLDTNYTSSIFEDSRGLLWIGSIRALQRLDRNTGKMTFYRRSGGPGELSSTWVISIAEDHSGRLWFGTVGRGVNRLDRRSGKFKVFRHDPADPRSLSHNTVQAILVDHKGVVWVGTEDGLCVFDEATESFRVYKAGNRLNESRVDYIAEEPGRALWIATQTTGLVRFDLHRRQFTSYRHTPDIDSLSDDSAKSVCIDHSGMIWVGTQNGLNRLDPRAGTFTRYYERDGLPASNISRVLEDDSGDLWVSTSRGLSRFGVQDSKFQNYYVSDGLAGNEFYNYASAFKSRTGEMFFSSYAGITAFFPRDVIDNPYIPPVVITELKIPGKPLPIGGGSVAAQVPPFTRAVKLPHDRNLISLQFSALSFTNPDGNRYRYIMEGLEDSWNESTSDQRFITYSLSPGQYVFRVKGSNSRGAWNEEGATLQIAILPPWWATWWFRTTCAVAALLMVGAAYQLRIRQLQRGFKKLQEVIETIPGYVWSARPDGFVDFINKRWLDFSGFSLEQALGWGWAAAVHPEDRDRLTEAWRTAFTSGQAMEAEVRVRRADGEYRWLLIRNVPQHDKTGRIVKWYGKSTDIDDRKRAEQALKRSEAYLADAQRLTGTGAWASDGTTRPLYWSEEVFRIFGFDPGDGLPSADQPLQRIHPKDRDRFWWAFQRTIQEKVDSEAEYRVVLPDGTVKHVHALAHPVLNPEGELVEVVGTIVDITDRKRAEEERERLRQLEADLAHINRVSMMGELAASIAHEVNQPLTGIVSNGSACLRFLAGDAPDLEEARDAVRDIVRDGKRAGEVIARIRALTKRTAPPTEKLDLNETVRDVLAIVGDEAKRNRVVIRTQFADGLFPVFGDRVQLQQVLLNLVMNAMEAMSSVEERARELVITTRNTGPGLVQVTVEDSGTGLDANTMARIFDPFYTTKSGGMGLGLSISRSIVQNHGGRLWATANEGPGTSFHFTLAGDQVREKEGRVAGV